MVEKIQTLIDGTESRDTLRYHIQSAHDTHVINTVAFLEPLNYNWIEMPFSSSLNLELHYNDTCLASQRDVSCFTVEIFNNGKSLKVDTCVNANLEKGLTSHTCTFSDFLSHVN
jgi:hypothetical protein